MLYDLSSISEGTSISSYTFTNEYDLSITGLSFATTQYTNGVADTTATN